MSSPSPRPSTSESADGQGSPAEREEQARQLCLRLLTARARTRSELASRLAKRGYPDDVGERVLDRLTDVGLIDDRDFAEQWVRSRHTHAGKGKRALVSELRTKGVDDELIDAALADVDPASERARAEQLVADRLRREKLTDEPGEDAKLVRRLVGMLARKGYGQTLAFDVIKVALASERERRRV